MPVIVVEDAKLRSKLVSRLSIKREEKRLMNEGMGGFRRRLVLAYTGKQRVISYPVPDDDQEVEEKGSELYRGSERRRSRCLGGWVPLFCGH